MEYLAKTESAFTRLCVSFKYVLLSARTNRPSPKVIEDIPVNYLANQMLIKQLGTINIEPPRDLVINIWDEQAVKSMSNAIEAANLGFSVSVQGKSVRDKLPDLTEERKQELIRSVKSRAEEARIKMRQERDEAVKKIKHVDAEDSRFRAKEKLQKLVDDFNNKVEEAVIRKSGEILE